MAIFEAPKFEPEAKRQVEIPFSISVPTLSHRSVVSGRIPYGFRILQVKMFFTATAANLVRHRWIVDPGPGVSTTGPPSGTNIFGRESPTAFFIGSGIIRIVNTNLEFPAGKLYIKFYTYNGTGAAYDANGAIIIQEM